MKKLASVVLVGGMIVGLAGCGAAAKVNDKVETTMPIEESINKDVSSDIEMDYDGEFIAGLIKKPCEDHEGGILVEGLFGIEGDVCLITDEDTVFANGEPDEYPIGYIISGYYTGKIMDGDVKQILLSTLLAVEEDQVISIDDPIVEGDSEASIGIQIEK